MSLAASSPRLLPVSRGRIPPTAPLLASVDRFPTHRRFCSASYLQRKATSTSSHPVHRRQTPRSPWRIEQCLKQPENPSGFTSKRYSTAVRCVSSHQAFIALGSNLGDRLKYVEEACSILDADPDVRLVRTSSLWETKAMYVTDQADFLNGVCEIETILDPVSLLDRLQAIERQLQRRKLIEKGPRTIDLDILLYDDLIMHSERLTIPHPLMLERAFVLQPLCQLIPDSFPPQVPENEAGTPNPEPRTYFGYLERLGADALADSTTTPLRDLTTAVHALNATRRTLVMSVLNITPDSFSDGGMHSSEDMKGLDNTVREQLAAGVDIIDVGGQSTRPQAEDVGAEEENRRVVPVIRLIKSILASSDRKEETSISVDTFRASVATAAVTAGADIVNDVSGGELDADMLPTVAQLGCTYMLMHMRGDPSTMTSKDHTSYPNGLINTICQELAERVERAQRAGIRGWRMILDPGIGFAKNGKQNLEILRGLDELREARGHAVLQGLPWVVGTSRKRFIGQVTGVTEARERVWGTAACVTAAVQGGADIVRVHDLREMGQVVRMADAIWRGR